MQTGGALPPATCNSVFQGIIQILKPYFGVKINSKVEFEFKTNTLTYNHNQINNTHSYLHC